MIYPKKLSIGSHIRIIAPARSLGLLSEEHRNLSIQRLNEIGIKVSYGTHVEEFDEFSSSSVESRLADIHEAFADPEIDGILTVVGGYNTNQLIQRLDYDLIRKNPKILCGFSDITCLAHAIMAKTNIVTYSGPHFAIFGMLKGFDYTLDYFKKCFFSNEPYDIISADEWSDDLWYFDQENRTFIPNNGWWLLNKGQEKVIHGKLLGGHIECLASLQGTSFWPSLRNCILFLEADGEVIAEVFERTLQSIILQPDFGSVKAILIGRFQKTSKMTQELLLKIIKTKPELQHIPVIGNFDIGHVFPIITYPIGGEITIDISNTQPKIVIEKH